jgi:hypothetical protein
VCHHIEKQSAGTVSRLDEFAVAVDIVAISRVPVLVRHGFLQSVSSPRKKVQGYQRGPNSPVTAAFFQSGPMGFTYFLTKCIRYYLKAYILSQMAQIESRDNMLPLGHLVPNNVGAEGWPLGGLSHAEGNWIDRRGIRWAVNIPMLEHWKSLEVWVIYKLSKTVASILNVEGSLKSISNSGATQRTFNCTDR